MSINYTVAMKKIRKYLFLLVLKNKCLSFDDPCCVLQCGLLNMQVKLVEKKSPKQADF